VWPASNGSRKSIEIVSVHGWKTEIHLKSEDTLMKALYCAALILVISSTPTFASVTVGSPANGGTVSSPVQYIASATTATCSKGVASMGVYVNNQLITVQNGPTLSAPVSLAPGAYNTVVEEWDYCGGATLTPVAITVTKQSGVFVTSPVNNSTVSSPANYMATAATTSCSKGVASIGVYVNNQLVVVQNGAVLNAQVNLGAGAQSTVVEEWDNCGGASYVPVNIMVQQLGTKLSSLQASTGWNSWGQGPPNYVDCSP